MNPQMSPSASEEAFIGHIVAVLRTAFERRGALEFITPRLLGPVPQGYVWGFIQGAMRARGCKPEREYSVRAQIYVQAFDGTPSGQQLGVDCLINAMKYGDPSLADEYAVQFHDAMSRGAAGAAHLAETSEMPPGLLEVL